MYTGPNFGLNLGTWGYWGTTGVLEWDLWFQPRIPPKWYTPQFRVMFVVGLLLPDHMDVQIVLMRLHKQLCMLVLPTERIGWGTLAVQLWIKANQNTNNHLKRTQSMVSSEFQQTQLTFPWDATPGPQTTNLNQHFSFFTEKNGPRLTSKVDVLLAEKENQGRPRGHFFTGDSVLLATTIATRVPYAGLT